MIYRKRLETLRDAIEKANIEGFIVPMNDEFQGEYIPDSAKRLEWLTRFDGSNGLAVVLHDKAAFFTDGRYTLQAESQISDAYERYNQSDVTPSEWSSQHLAEGKKLGFDSWLHTKNSIEHYRKRGITLVPCSPNLIDQIWEDQPAPPCSEVKIHEIIYAGETSEAKRKKLAEYLSERNIDSIVITAPDSICWLLNIRGDDVPHTPFSLCFAVVNQDKTVELFIDRNKLSPDVIAHLGGDVCVYDISHIVGYFSKIEQNKTFQLDPSHASFWFFDALKNNTIKEAQDPCQLWKACKNNVEINGTKTAHIRDGAAVTRFLHWLDTRLDKELITERSATIKLEGFRAENDLFQDLSFDTISGFAGHGAIVHYRVTEESSKTLTLDGIYLVDSGGQYLDGTTDITRTLALGTPTDEQKNSFTRVLKGHIALARAVFPEGTTGSQLDTLARYHLWQAGLDYDHGTGHGVGSYLSVHEGPQRISKHPNPTALQPGMIISNEPGYYKEGEYGIRIESLVLVVEKPELSQEKKRFFGFETLTKAPLDTSLIADELLTESEKEWIMSYHKDVRESLESLLEKDVYAWLKKAVE